MDIQIAAAKTNKYATPESGDTLEMVERPNGGVSVVLADGQSSGRGAKAVSTLVVRKLFPCSPRAYGMELPPGQHPMPSLPKKMAK